MKKLSQAEVSHIFLSNGYLLIGEYKGYTEPLLHRCKCGFESEISLETFKKRLKRNQGCSNCSKQIWTEQEDQILKQFYGKESRQFILDKLPGRTYQMLKTRSEILGLKGNRSIALSKARKDKYRQYSFDINYFDKIDSNQSYWAGFIATNGCISEKYSCVTIRLLQEYRYHLEKFQDTVLHTGLISQLSCQSMIGFYGAGNWVDKLHENYNITTKESLEPPQKLNEHNSLCYIIGCLDGSLSKSSSNDQSMQFNGTYNLLIWIKFWFDKWCPAVKKRYAEVHKNKKKFRYTISGARANYLLKMMSKIELPRLLKNKQPAN